MEMSQGTISWSVFFLKRKEKNRAFQMVLGAKNPPVNAGDARDVGLILGLGRSPGLGNSNPL